MGKAKAPSRATIKFPIAFGLVTVPVVAFKATEEVGIKRSWYAPDGNQVGYVTVNKGTGESIARSEIINKFACTDGTLVDLSDEEIEAAGSLGPNGSADVIGFFPLDTIGSFVVDGNYQIRPQTVTSGKKKVRPFDKPFALLMTALNDKGVYALVRFVASGKTRVGVLTGDGVLRTVCFTAEVREDAEWPEVELSEAEKTMAGALVESLLLPTPPTEIEDEAAERVRAYAEAKAAAGGGSTPIPAPAAEVPAVDDLMAVLQASVDAAKAAKVPA